ncbi:MAG: hypothetical protein BGP24_23400 [Lysobacterales bacterium 69-70]|nr:hypothetical protein [Xanthomonadaceae bacterium]ODU34331.1 MAG: hypothetical protein ABS97_09580 [Xanthomonadaceae bacterium SCN 69-320]ODV22440.1 MAG: hypothetical protein ABT27_01740 [Xanthomonadaceae bacterium SCN 69-25]OJY96237.1 MAG: hypothetical protein BGP24_23400 [Xanthomonadales bacterium 69-70]
MKRLLRAGVVTIGLALALVAANAAALLLPDPGFGRSGEVVLGAPAAFDQVPPFLAAYDDGRIVAALAARDYASPGLQLLIYRLVPDGRPDPSFGANGQVLLRVDERPLRSRLRQVDALADGGMRLVLSVAVPESPALRAVIIQLGPDGSADPRFNRGQPLRWDLPPARDVVLRPQGDGLLLIALRPLSFGYGSGAPAGMDVWRLQGDGSLDARFGRNGRISETDESSGISDVLVLPDGGFQTVNSEAGSGRRATRWRRYTADGQYDIGFGPGGWRDALPAAYDPLSRLLPLGDGRLLATSRAGSILGYVDARGELVAFPASFSQRVDYARVFGGERVFASSRRDSGWSLPTDGTYLLAFRGSGQPDRSFGEGGAYRLEGYWLVAGQVVVDAPGSFVVGRPEYSGGFRLMRQREFDGAALQPIPATPPPARSLLALGLVLAALAALRRRARHQRPPRAPGRFL